MAQRAGTFQPVVKGAGAELQAVWPAQRPQFEEESREILALLERAGKRGVAGEDLRQIAFTRTAIAEREPQDLATDQ